MKKITITVLLFSASLIGFGQISANLRADFDFENGIADSSIQNHATTITGAFAYGNDMWGNPNASGQFSGDATPGNISLTNTSGNYKVSYPATISAWVKINNFGSVVSPIVTTEDHASNYSGLWVEVTAAGAVFASYGNNTAAGSTSRKSFATSNGTITLNTWHHVVVVYNSSTSATIYVNGFVKPNTVSGLALACVYANSAGSNGKIGGYLKGSVNKTLDGQVDKVKIFAAALTHSQVLALYYTSHTNHSTLLFNYNMNNNFSDISIYNQTSAELGTCQYENDRLALANAALNTSTTSAVEIQNATGNFKTGFPMTFSTWLKLDAIGSSTPIFTNDDNPGVYTGMWVQLTAGGNIAVQIGDGSTVGPTARRTYITTSALTANSQWNHLAVVLKAAPGLTQYTTQVYLNGVLQPVGAQSGTGGALYYGSTVGSWGKIGAYMKGVGTTTAMDGAMDDAMFWDDSLTVTQIQDLMTNYYNGTVSVGINENLTNNSNVNVFPNPSEGEFTITVLNDVINEVSILDVTGKQILNKSNVGSNVFTVNLSEFAKGIYVVKIRDGEKITVRKVIKN